MRFDVQNIMLYIYHYSLFTTYYHCDTIRELELKRILTSWRRLTPSLVYSKLLIGTSERYGICLVYSSRIILIFVEFLQTMALKDIH